MIANNILETIGNTPHIKMQRLFGDANVWIKSERSNPGGSIKDRIGLAMIEDAEKSGALKPGGTDIRQYRRRTGDGRRGQGLYAHSRHARVDVARTAPPDARLWRQL